MLEHFLCLMLKDCFRNWPYLRFDVKTIGSIEDNDNNNDMVNGLTKVRRLQMSQKDSLKILSKQAQNQKVYQFSIGPINGWL